MQLLTLAEMHTRLTALHTGTYTVQGVLLAPSSSLLLLNYYHKVSKVCHCVIN